MNYVLIAIIAAAIIAVPGYLLAAILAFVLSRQGRDREVVEARLYTERDDALLRCERLTADNEQYSEAVVELNEEKLALIVRNTALRDALNDVQAEIKALHMQRGTVPVKLRRTGKKAGSE